MEEIRNSEFPQEENEMSYGAEPNYDLMSQNYFFVNYSNLINFQDESIKRS